MDQAKEIFKKHLNNRKAVLLKIYTLTNGLSGRTVSYTKSFEDISSYPDQERAARNYLVTEGLIEITDEFHDLRITHQGIKAVEQFMSEEKATLTSVIKNKFWLF